MIMTIIRVFDQQILTSAPFNRPPPAWCPWEAAPAPAE